MALDILCVLLMIIQEHVFILLGTNMMQLGRLIFFLLTYPRLEKLSTSDMTMELNLLQSHSGPYLFKNTSNKNFLHHILYIRMEQLRDLGELCLIWSRCMIIESQLPKCFWTYAVKTAAYIRNRCYCPRTGKDTI